MGRKLEIGQELKGQIALSEWNLDRAERFFRRLNRFGTTRLSKIKAGFQEKRDVLFSLSDTGQEDKAKVQQPFATWRRLSVMQSMTESVRERKEIHLKNKEGIKRLEGMIAKVS